jgi:hypothetical protein
MTMKVACRQIEMTAGDGAVVEDESDRVQGGEG